jgi:anaerobic carbon-monoxide dehydrogenase iron sulfur subunit
MDAILVVEGARCTGCKLCELACSLVKDGCVDPTRSRIRIRRCPEGRFLPVVCQRCTDPLCAVVCPVEAVRKDEAAGAPRYERERCVGCGACVAVCPHGAAGFDAAAQKALRCDLCGGRPACVAVCTAGALRLMGRDEARLLVQRAAARRLLR